jgi:hypothetical protein
MCPLVELRSDGLVDRSEETPFCYPTPLQSNSNAASVPGSMKAKFNSCILGFASLISEQAPYDPTR